MKLPSRTQRNNWIINSIKFNICIVDSMCNFGTFGSVFVEDKLKPFLTEKIFKSSKCITYHFPEEHRREIFQVLATAFAK